jgi:hypothetical protein
MVAKLIQFFTVVGLVMVLVLFPLVGPSAAQDGKVGYLGYQYLQMPVRQKDAYTTGVVDALDVMGVKCPTPPSYAQIMADTDAFIVRNPEARGVWAATSIMAAMAQRGCTRQ